MNIRTKIIATLLPVVLSGCVNDPAFFGGYTELKLIDYEEMSDDALVSDIREKLMTTWAIERFSPKETEPSNVNWKKQASIYSSCLTDQIKQKASREDLEVINLIWLDNYGKEHIAAEYASIKYYEKDIDLTVYLFSKASYRCELSAVEYTAPTAVL